MDEFLFTDSFTLYKRQYKNNIFFKHQYEKRGTLLFFGDTFWGILLYFARMLLYFVCSNYPAVVELQQNKGHQILFNSVSIVARAPHLVKRDILP